VAIEKEVFLPVSLTLGPQKIDILGFNDRIYEKYNGKAPIEEGILISHFNKIINLYSSILSL